MSQLKTGVNFVSDKQLQERRLHLIHLMEDRVLQSSQAELLRNLETSKAAIFVISDKAAATVREGLQDKHRRESESTALAQVSIAAQTPDKSGVVYRIDSFRFERIGTSDYVVAPERDRLGAGEIEIHTHVYTRPMYLDRIDINDVIAAVSGPAWVDPQTNTPQNHLRIFGILSVHPTHIARLQVYCHNLKTNLSVRYNYGLKKAGPPITVLDAF